MRSRLVVILIVLNFINLYSDNGFIQVSSENPQEITDGSGDPFHIKGISFGNHVWSNPKTSSWFKHHTNSDFKKVKDFGFNSIRFYINYGLFEDDNNPYNYKEEGFEWLDKNIKAAKENNIYLILNMHFPQGGFQPNGEGALLWSSEEHQERLISLWKVIAERYSNEEAIIGYGILNEPYPVESLSQWSDLAQKIVDEIREVDNNHILFVERALWVEDGATPDEKENLLFPSGLKDKSDKNNIVYEFHLYTPLEFTHQNASWLDFLRGRYFKYPDKDRSFGYSLKWKGHSTSKDIISIENNHDVARVVLQAGSIGKKGMVSISDIKVDEVDSSGEIIKNVITYKDANIYDWHFWSDDESGEIKSDNKNITIKGTTSDANISLKKNIYIEKGKQYRVSANIQGQKIEKDGYVNLRFDYYSLEGDRHRWDKKGLESEIAKYIQWSKKNRVPLYLGEFGTIKDSFKDGRGGQVWLKDLFDIIYKYKIHYNYHTYHGPEFGLYMHSTNELPNEKRINPALRDILYKLKN